ITLPRYQSRIPNIASGISVHLGGVSTQDIITVANGVAEAHDKSVDELERSIRQSAKVSFRLNLMCCFAALVGFATQFGQYRHDERNKAQRKPSASDYDSKLPTSIPHLQESETKPDDTAAA